MVPRLFIDCNHLVAREWVSCDEMSLPEQAVRHAQVLRLQPGDSLTLFNGHGGEWAAEVVSIGRRDVQVRLQSHTAVSRELPLPITLAVGMPANDRMDTVVEKATELGVSAIQPLICARSVLRLDGERAIRKVAHWQSVASAACEQCGRTRVPVIFPLQAYKSWLDEMNGTQGHKGVLSFIPSQSVLDWVSQRLHILPAAVFFLSGPEGGLLPEEESQALTKGWSAIGLGPRVLRADTAPLMALSVLAACVEGR